jgi:hypothetical protein
MKKILLILGFASCLILSVKGQTTSSYSYLLDNGINVRTEHGWSHVWVSQSYDALKEGELPVAVNIRVMGDLKISSTYKLISGGKEVKMQGAAPGTYDLKLTFKLSGKPGTLSFVVNNVIIKPKSKTSLSVTLYDYQINITETPSVSGGLSSYESSVNSYKGSVDTNPNKGVFTFYDKGKHDAKLTPAEATSEIKGKIKPGTYDVLITIAISGQKHEVWLENFTMKADVNYKIGTNLNAGVIAYTGVNKEIKEFHLYPAGTAATQAKPAIDKTKEIINHENISMTNPCAPGSYDVLLEYGKGAKFEWRKGITIQSGQRFDVK